MPRSIFVTNFNRRRPETVCKGSQQRTTYEIFDFVLNSNDPLPRVVWTQKMNNGGLTGGAIVYMCIILKQRICPGTSKQKRTTILHFDSKPNSKKKTETLDHIAKTFNFLTLYPTVEGGPS